MHLLLKRLELYEDILLTWLPEPLSILILGLPIGCILIKQANVKNGKMIVIKRLYRDFNMKKKMDFVLTVAMVDIVDTDDWINGLLPSKRQFVTNTIGKRLRFGVPRKKI